MKNKNTIIHDFDDLWDSSQNQFMQKNLLLGNGFSCRCWKQFSYEKIFENSQLSPYIKSYFSPYNINYESVIEQLEYEGHIYEQCCDVPEARYYIGDNIEAVKLDLKIGISNSHPKKHNLNNTTWNWVIYFISRFNNIFTLNYDHLLYWAIMDINDSYNDGFSYNSPYDNIWTNRWDNQNIFYLHGANFLFADNNNNTFKVKATRKHSLQERIDNYIKFGDIPLSIVEGNYLDKLDKIKNNPYLRFCYNQLSNISGILVIYGVSFNDNDTHIFNALNKNRNINKIYISVYQNDENVINNAKKIFNYRILTKSLQVYFYNAESI